MGPIKQVFTFVRTRLHAFALVCVVASIIPTPAFALGLGSIRVHSALNEPLNAEIELISASQKELKGLNAALATRAEFDGAGVERLPYLSLIKFTVARKLDGRYVLQLNTEQQIDEPFLHLVVQVEWPGGRLVREYAALIDPPQQIRAKPSGIDVPATTKGAEPATGAATGVIAPLEDPTAVAPIVEPATPAATGAETGPSAEPIPEPAATAKAEGTPATTESQGKVAESVPPTAAPLPEEVSALPPPVEPLASVEPVAAPTETGLLGPGSTETATPDSSQAVSPLSGDSAKRTAEMGVAPAARDARVASAPTPAWAKVGEYTVKRGDTLWGIVEQVRDDRQLTMEQAVLAVYKANRDAFFGNNVNNLHAGKILKIPERDLVEGTSAPAARKEFRAQYDVWQEYKLKLASSGNALKVPDAVTPAEPKAEPKPTAKAESAPVATKPKDESSPAAKKPEATAPAGKSPDDMLKIVRSNLQDDKKKGTPEKKVGETESSKDAKERQALADRATTLEESLVSRQIEAKDLADKIGQVRAQLKKESRLIELESQALAQATKKTAPPETKTSAEKPVKTEAPKEAAKAEAPKTEPPKAEPPKAEVAKPAEMPAKTEAPKPTGSLVEKKAEPKKDVPVAEEKGFVDAAIEALSGDALLYVGGGLGIVGLIVGVVYARRRKKSIAEFEESILSADSIVGDTGAVTSSTDTAGAVVSAGDTSFLSDFSQGGMGNIHTDEVDPVAEADVYLAYGRDETAEEILKDAVVKNPDRHELKIKLLEIYHQRNDVQAFETLAEELYAALGGRRDKNWERVEEMGRKLNPSNPMFSGGAPAGKAAGAKKAFADTQRGGQQAAAAAPPPPASEGSDSINLDFSGLNESAPAAKAAEPAALDFDLGSGLDMGSSESKADSGGIDFGATLKASAADLNAPSGGGSLDSLDFSLGDASPSTDSGGISFEPGLSAGPGEPESAPAASSGGGLDFDLDLASSDIGAEAAVAEAPPAGVPAGGGSSGQWDETATKLDLAKAYIDMGDAEGARSILDEVLAEGSDEQKREAQQLASQLG